MAAPRYELKSPLVQRSCGGRDGALTRFLARRIGDPSATSTYTTKALVLLVEFGDEAWPAGSPAPTGPMTPGPAHGAIPAPAPDDNRTYWPGDFSRMHYQQLLFGNSYSIYDAAGAYRGNSDSTMRNYYLEQSHGTFTCPATLPNGSSSTCPSRGTAPTATPWNFTDDLTGPAWRVARDAVPSSPRRTRDSRGPTTTTRTPTASPGTTSIRPTATSTI